MSKYRCTVDNGCASYHSSPEEARKHLEETNRAVILIGGVIGACLIVGCVVCCGFYYWKKRLKQQRVQRYHQGENARKGDPSEPSTIPHNQPMQFHNVAFSIGDPNDFSGPRNQTVTDSDDQASTARVADSQASISGNCGTSVTVHDEKTDIQGEVNAEKSKEDTECNDISKDVAPSPVKEKSLSRKLSQGSFVHV